MGGDTNDTKEHHVSRCDDTSLDQDAMIQLFIVIHWYQFHHHTNNSCPDKEVHLFYISVQAFCIPIWMYISKYISNNNIVCSELNLTLWHSLSVELSLTLWKAIEQYVRFSQYNKPCRRLLSKCVGYKNLLKPNIKKSQIWSHLTQFKTKSDIPASMIGSCFTIIHGVIILIWLAQWKNDYKALF